MTYPCGIIRDLLPLYIDNVCNDESKQAVENHLSECEKCRSYYKAMKSTYVFATIETDNSEDKKMADCLKKVKFKINKKIRNIIICAVAAVTVFITGFSLLFIAAVKDVPLDDVSISADVYSLAELIENPADNVPDSETVTIFSNEDDKSESMDVKIPKLGKISLTKDTIEKNKYATIISFSSEYFLKTIKHKTEDDTIYVSAFKTTILNNRAENYQKTMRTLELKEINRIIFVDNKGKETVLWSR